MTVLAYIYRGFDNVQNDIELTIIQAIKESGL